MSAGQDLWIVAVGIQGILHHVVTGDVGDVHEQTPSEIVQVETLAQLGAVDDDARHTGG